MGIPTSLTDTPQQHVALMVLFFKKCFRPVLKSDTFLMDDAKKDSNIQINCNF
jgi:hypothetical protein